MNSLLPIARALVALGLGIAPATSAAGVPQVATDIPVVQSLAAMVMGSLGEPVVLMDAGADAHDYQLRPSQAAALENAELLVWVGPEMTPWLDRPASARSADTVLGLLDLPQTHRRHFAPEGAHDVEDHSHDHDGIDPHAWLDPANAGIWVQAIADRLVVQDPEHAEAYRANARAAKDRIATLDGKLAALLAPARGKPLILGHDAYGYLADRYGLAIAGTLATGDAASPGAARLSSLQKIAAGSGAACFLPEAGQTDAITRTLTEGTDLRIGAAMDPEGRTLPGGAGLYPALMMALGDAIHQCVTAPPDPAP